MLFRSLAGMFLALLASEPSHACRMYSDIVLDDVKYADAVVVGRISNYKIVRDNEFRRKMLSRPTLPDDIRKIYEDPAKTLLVDYAHFDVEVSEVLLGKAPDRLSVTWDNSTFGEPETLPAGPFLIALRDPSSRMPPLRGPSATVLPSPEPGSMTVLQAPCSGAFIFESPGNEALVVRSIVESLRR